MRSFQLKRGIIKSHNLERNVIIADILPESVERTPSYKPRYGNKTRIELERLAKKGDLSAAKMKKLVDQSRRLQQKNKNPINNMMNIRLLVKEMSAKTKQIQILLSNLTDLWGDDYAFIESILNVKDKGLLMHPSIILLMAEKLQTLNDPSLYNHFDLKDIKELYQINVDLNNDDIGSIKELALYMDAVLGETEGAVKELEKATEINNRLRLDLQEAIKQVSR